MNSTINLLSGPPLKRKDDFKVTIYLTATIIVCRLYLRNFSLLFYFNWKPYTKFFDFLLKMSLEGIHNLENRRILELIRTQVSVCSKQKKTEYYFWVVRSLMKHTNSFLPDIHGFYLLINLPFSFGPHQLHENIFYLMTVRFTGYPSSIMR